MPILKLAVLVLLLNLPFGYWRASVPKFSWQWFAAVHLPVPAVVWLRFTSGLGWSWFTFPPLVLAFFTGQFAGGWLRRVAPSWSWWPTSACLAWDCVRALKTWVRRLN
ncbi:hypothetical protein [Ammonifex thiophilus]|uniref:hypothetical protein n=1 Tax=Ammonifex thiophilus TaxID=444093 RepID=UPI00196AAAB5|nr:hypothetical protein [Ammonifex thiophilus]